MSKLEALDLVIAIPLTVWVVCILFAVALARSAAKGDKHGR